MKLIQTRWLLSATAAIILSACTTTAGIAAPVTSGTDGYGYNNGTVSTPYGSATVPTTGNTSGYGYNNGTVSTPYGTVTTPYGTTAVSTTAPTTAVPAGTVYTPPSTAAITPPYSAPVEPTYTAPAVPTYAQPTYTAPTSYRTVGNYPPVDINATHHRVVAGDTVFNISKRYGISQDQLRSWNGLSDNTIKLGQTLRVKPQGYTGKGASSSTRGTSTVAGTHRVVVGDSLYSLSKRYHVSIDQLRAWNKLSSDDIQLGQVLRVTGSNTTVAKAPVVAKTPIVAPTPNPTYTAQAPSAVTPDVPSSPALVVTEPVASNTIIVTQPDSTAKTSSKDGITWQTPLIGSHVAQSFSQALRGIELSGNKGQPVSTVADGQVIYAGLGPKGYGNLIVVQHTPKYLTAYSNVENFTIKEGESVKRGQTLGLLGTQKLHFEIRQDSKAVNPTEFIVF